MDISIIIVSFNTKDLTVSCIESVINWKESLTLEIIVVDNGSIDRSQNAIKTLKNKYPKIDITLIENTNNLGFSKANNQGIRMAKGRYVLLLNSDTIVKKGALNELVKFAENNSNIGVIGAKLLNGDSSVQNSCLNFPTVKLAIMQYWLGVSRGLDKYSPEGEDAKEVDAVVGAAMLITPKAREKAGLLNEKYFFYFEDLDYCRLVRRKGLKVYYLPKAKIVHYHGASTKKIKSDSNAWRKLIPGSKIYHGNIIHNIFNFIIWSGTKWRRLKEN